MGATIGLIAWLAMLGTVSQASAAIVTVTYEGQVYSSEERFVSRFGDLGIGNLVDASYKAVYVFDTSVGEAYSSATESYVVGGTGTSSPSPLISAVTTINNISVSLPGEFFARTGAINLGPNSFSQQSQLARDQYGNTNNYFQNFVFNSMGTLSGSVTTPFTYNTLTSDNWLGTVSFETYDPVADALTDFTNIKANLYTLTVDVGAVPEPPHGP